MHLYIKGTKCLKRSLTARKLLTSSTFCLTSGLKCRSALRNLSDKRLGFLASFIKSCSELCFFNTTVFQSSVSNLKCLSNLSQPRLKHLVFYLCMSNLLFKLYIRKRLFISSITSTAFRRSTVRNLYIKSTTLGDCLVGSLLQCIHTLCQICNLCTNCCQLTRKLFLLFCSVSFLFIHHRKLHACIRKARNHVLALLLQKTHVRTHTAKNLLHTTALLA